MSSTDAPVPSGVGGRERDLVIARDGGRAADEAGRGVERQARVAAARCSRAERKNVAARAARGAGRDVEGERLVDESDGRRRAGDGGRSGGGRQQGRAGPGMTCLGWLLLYQFRWIELAARCTDNIPCWMS